ncbi:MAG TPA: HAMP domain-containing protein [Rhodospirillaceae bacterium]|nr:HAMP domain-containing protein [Rhodospirillaceae bacterium]
MRSLRPIVKAILPRGLLGRSLLILVTPLVLLQLVSAYIFYGTHWDLITRRLTTALAGEIGAVIQLMQATPDKESRDKIFSVALATMDLRLTLREGATLANTGMLDSHRNLSRDSARGSLEGNLLAALAERVGRPVLIDTLSREQDISILVQVPEGILRVTAPRKRLYSPTTTIFTLWMIGTSLLLFGIATLFTRNQVRAVRRLAIAADSFGKGRDVPNFKPEGAAEVRQAAAAFALMRDRIKRQVDQRTEMLAGVSHDLRTPLTRMKLELAMMDGDGIDELKTDIAEMERMVEGYLAFARGAGNEPMSLTDLSLLIEDVAAKCRREGGSIDVECEPNLILQLRPDAIRRCLTNLTGNAQRYARRAVIRAARHADHIEVVLDDDGPGIPPPKREEVFRAFQRLESSRNPTTGGVGLGLTIARDVVRGHGGDILLEDSPMGGLRVRLRLPI